MSSTNAKVLNVLNPTDIEQLLAMRETQRSMRERLALIDESISGLENEVLTAIDLGADLRNLKYAVSVQTTERRYPSWKEHFISRLGKSEADSVLELTAPVTHRKLVIK